jgi:hypothetical protein
MAIAFILWFGIHSARRVEVKRYPFVGQVVELKPGTRTVRVHNENMPGFMEAMDMDYVVKDSEVLDSLRPGDAIHATLLSDHENVWELENVTVAK